MKLYILNVILKNNIPLLIFIVLLSLVFFLLSKEIVKTNLYKKRSTKLIIFAFMTGLATIFQSSPVFIPVLGMMISPFSSLPIAVGALLFPKSVFLLYISTAFVTSLFSVQEATIFIFTTGPVGLATSLLVIQEKIKLRRIWIPVLVLSSGILVLSYVIGLQGIEDVFNGHSILYIGSFTIIFSTIYTLIWSYFIKFIKKRLRL